MNHSVNFHDGEVILIDKPLKITSFGAVNRIKRVFIQQTKKKRYKIGHAGTLDPLATGLLIMCSGKKTKTISSFQNLPKEYTATIKLGATTPSYDLETEVDKTFEISNITENDIRTCAASFIGEQDQLPPIFSAKKIDGKRAYNLARAGEEVKVKPNKISIYVMEVLEIKLPEVKVRIACSKGTYIRSIAYDFGVKLNNGAHLTELRRTKIGEYDVNDAYTIEEVQQWIFDSEFIPLD